MNASSEHRLPRVLVVTSETLLAEGICALLSNSGVCDVIGSVSSADELFERTRELRPNVLLVDTVIPISDSEQVIQAVNEDSGDTCVLLLGYNKHSEPIFRGLKAGAKGYVSRTESSSVLVSAILNVFNGEYSLSPSAAKMLVDEYRRINIDIENGDNYRQLTNREKDVLKLIADGLSNREIAGELNISIRTAMGHRAKLMQKLDIHNATGLIMYAIRKHLVEVQN